DKKRIKKTGNGGKTLQKMLDKAKKKKEGDEQEAAVNAKMKIVQEQIEELSKELASR
ncbi:8761_t:CDS:1, partial [Scutellospora calospora]